MQYAVELAVPGVPDGPPALQRGGVHVAMDPRVLPGRVFALAREIRGSLAPDAPQHRIVERFRSEISRRFTYLAPGAEGGARSFSEFLEGKAGAHCEYFATALAVMLRLEKIPCRVVTGYRSEEWDRDRGTVTFRASDAHAWVEVLDPAAGWTTVDATPPFAAGAGNGRGLWAAVKRIADRLWSGVAGFNAEARGRVFAWLAALPGRIARNPGDAALFGTALALVLVAARLRRRRREEPHGRAYRRTLRKLKLDLEPSETPRELLARARRTAYPADGLRELEVATAAHEQARYVV